MAVRDKLEELIFLKKPTVIISEWMPWGNNQIAALNRKLGSMERLKSTLMTALVDEFPEQSIFESDPIHSDVVVKDFELTQYVEFRCKVDYPEAAGIEQVEEFAAHIHEQGLVVFALDLKEVEGRKGVVSVDHLTRVNTDLLMDSSQIMETLLAHSQLRMMDVMFRGKSQNRGKFVLVVSEGITPRKGKASSYADQEDYQNELEQVVGTLEVAETVSDNSLIFIGDLGVIVVTKNFSKYEEVLGLYALVRSLDMFMNQYFSRLWLGWDDSLQIRQMFLHKADRDPTMVAHAKTALSKVGADAVVLEALMNFLKESIDYTKEQITRILKKTDAKQKEFARKLHLQKFFDRVENRIDDAEKVVAGLKREVEGLQGLVTTLGEKQMKKVFDTLQDSSRATEEMLASSERGTVALNIIEIILAGTIAFDIIEVSNTIGFLEAIFPPGFGLAGTIMILGATFAIWVTIAIGLYRFMAYLTGKHEPLFSMQLRLEAACHVDRVDKYLSTKDITTLITKQDGVAEATKVSWDEDDKSKWLGEKPKISIVYDGLNGYILTVIAEFANPNIDREALRRILLKEIQPLLKEPNNLFKD
jgi:WD repeat-containing protein 35